MFQDKSFREWLVGRIPDSFNFCTKYTGKHSVFRGANAPAWMVYKLLFHPQDKCLYRWENGAKVEKCICCHDVWFNSITALVMLMVCAVSVLVTAPAMFWGWAGTTGLILVNIFLILSIWARFANVQCDENHSNKLKQNGEQND